MGRNQEQDTAILGNIRVDFMKAGRSFSLGAWAAEIQPRAEAR
jgi:hypothetical protein